jgi:hypothetical protein
MAETWWTTEQVCEFLRIDRQSLYDSRARGKFPGNRGHRRGKRLLFPASEIEEGKALVEAGDDPDLPDETADPTVAMLWQLQAIHKTLRAIHTELRGQRPIIGYLDTTIENVNTTFESEEEE